MATKVTTDKTAADSAAASDIAGADSTVLAGADLDTGSGSADLDTPPAKPEPAPAPAKSAAGRASAKRVQKDVKERVEEYISHKPDGNGGYIQVTVRRNVETGASEIVDG